MGEREPRENRKKQTPPWERPGGVIAVSGEASAIEARKLRWQLTPAEKKVVDFVMSHEADNLRNTPPEQLAERSKKIQALFDDDTDETD